MPLAQAQGLKGPTSPHHVGRTQKQGQSRQPAGARWPALLEPEAPLPNATRQQNQEHWQQGGDIAVVLIRAEMGKDPSH